MRQEELSADHLVRDLVVIGLAVQLDEGGVGREVIPAPGGGEEEHEMHRDTGEGVGEGAGREATIRTGWPKAHSMMPFGTLSSSINYSHPIGSCTLESTPAAPQRLLWRRLLPPSRQHATLPGRKRPADREQGSSHE